jgi:hypothetical protein
MIVIDPVGDNDDTTKELLVHFDWNNSIFWYIFSFVMGFSVGIYAVSLRSIPVDEYPDALDVSLLQHHW